ncbi:MAG: hypothetical protein Q7T19_02455 [Caulobacter sp.]|nr:hypothetical protein [Caulobacter sp.]
MRILTIAAVVVTAAASTSAFAADARLTDGQFVKASHCRGLASGAEAARFDSLLKAQRLGRSSHIRDRADSARSEGERLSRTDAAAAQAALTGECARFGA